MKRQIKRFSSHQNGKVLGVLMAVMSLFFAIPLGILATMFPPIDQQGNKIGMPTFIFFLFPFFYLIGAYIWTRLGCAIYNRIVRYIGGFEFELGEE